MGGNNYDSKISKLIFKKQFYCRFCQGSINKDPYKVDGFNYNVYH